MSSAFVLMGAMRIDEDALALHLEVSLSGAAPALLDGLNDSDRRRRTMAVSDLARHLTERLRCFDIRSDEAPAARSQAALFPDDLGPMA